MLEFGLSLLLSFSHPPAIILIIILGYVWLDHKIFFHATCLLLLSILINTALKCTFKVPLSPVLMKEGFAFPSGHMQSALVFYGWLFKSFNNLIWKTCLVILLIGIGLSLIYFKFHNLFDVLGALFFGSIILLAYQWGLNYYKEEQFSIVTIAFALALTVYISLIHPIQHCIWVAQSAMIVLLFCQWHFKK